MGKVTGFLIMLLALNSVAIVNIESLRGDIELGADKTTIAVTAEEKKGGPETKKFKTTASYQLLTDFWESLIITEYELASTTNVVSTHSRFLHWRNGFYPTEMIYPEFFVQYSKNEIARLSLRTVVGGGARIRIIDREYFKLYSGLGAFQSVEKLEARSGTSDHGTADLIRISSYLSLRWQIDKDFTFHYVTYFQPSARRSADFRVFSTYELKAKVNDVMSVTFAFKYTKDSEPPELVRPHYTELNTLLGFAY